MRSTQVVPGRTITASRLAIRATPDAVEVTGPVRIGNVRANGTWRQPLGAKNLAGSVAATVDLNPQFLDEFKIALPPGTVSGATKARLNLALRRGQSVQFDLSTNMSGLGLSIPAVGYRKPRGRRGSFKISGTLGSPVTIRGFSMDLPGLKTSGTLKLTSRGQLDRAQLNDVRLGNWLRSNVTVIGQGRGKPVALALRGGRLNLPRAPFGAGSSGGAGNGARGKITAQLDRLVISDSISLTAVSAEILAGRGLDGRFQGRVNGGTRVNGFTKRAADGLIVQITSDDAGGALRDAGLLRQANSGAMDLTLRAQNGGWQGDLKVVDARVKDAPAVAAVLSAVSVIGILEQMDGKGLLFNDIRAKFSLKGDQFTLFSSSAIGPSLGLSLDGFINTRTKQLDLQGVLSPFYLLNGIGAIFTRRGEGLIGFNFNLTGPTAKPRVAVNPLSALTPGMFREIFRRPPPKQP